MGMYLPFVHRLLSCEQYIGYSVRRLCQIKGNIGVTLLHVVGNIGHMMDAPCFKRHMEV